MNLPKNFHALSPWDKRIAIVRSVSPVAADVLRKRKPSRHTFPKLPKNPDRR